MNGTLKTILILIIGFVALGFAIKVGTLIFKLAMLVIFGYAVYRMIVFFSGKRD